MDAAITYFPSGETPVGLPGDIFLTSGNALLSRAIQFGQRWGLGMRYARKHARWNHAGVFIDSDVIGHSYWYGPQEDSAEMYTDSNVVVISPDVSEEDRAQAVKWATSVIDEDTFSYAYTMYTGLLFSLLTGLRIGISSASSIICSAYAADMLRCYGVKFPVSVPWVTPAMLAEMHLGE